MAKQFAFYGSLHGLRLDRNAYNKTFDEAAKRLVRQAARAWLRAVIVRVAVYSGFAMGSIKFAQGPNGDLARYLNVAVPISPNAKAPRWYYYNGTRTPKTPERGGAFGEYNFPSSQRRYRFRYSNSVIHFAINEFFADVSPTSPWHAMEAGREAFNNYLRENIGKLPKVKDFIVKSDPKHLYNG